MAIETFEEWSKRNNITLKEDVVDTGVDHINPAVAPQVHGNSGISSIIRAYVKDGSDLKNGLKTLGDDLGKAIVDYALNVLVTDDMFESETIKNTKYEIPFRNKVEEGFNKTLSELLKNIGITITELKGRATK